MRATKWFGRGSNDMDAPKEVGWVVRLEVRNWDEPDDGGAAAWVPAGWLCVRGRWPGLRVTEYKHKRRVYATLDQAVRDASAFMAMHGRGGEQYVIVWVDSAAGEEVDHGA